jgi:hypothetical protein
VVVAEGDVVLARLPAQLGHLVAYERRASNTIGGIVTRLLSEILTWDVARARPRRSSSDDQLIA